MKCRIFVILVTLAFALPASTQERRLVEGELYSYFDAAGVRYYTTSEPPVGARDVKKLRYNYYETVVGYPIARTFGGFPCKQDCSGHKAGYDWARKKGIRAASQCGGRSQSFIEGCIAYAEGLLP